MRRLALFAAPALLGVALCAVAWAGPPRDPRAPVYARGSSAAASRFSHRLAEHAAQPCAACHALRAEGPGLETLAAAEASCQPCHAEAIERAHASAATCGKCHTGYEPGQAPALGAAPSPSPALHFSHRAHLARGAGCASCHAGPEHAELPSMATCLDCHRTPAGRRCATCHASLPDGRLRTRLPGGVLVPRSSFLSMAHDGDWGVRHRWVAADQGQACQSCHAERECRRCHDGRRPPPSVHPNDFLALHAQDARRAPARCDSCHTAQSLCFECHTRLGLAITSAPDLRAGGRFHPPAAQWTRGAAEHGVEARRSLSACVSCHAERDCVQCHGAAGVGGAGLSPHPADFIGKCGRALRSNSRACRSCHTDLAALAERCR